MRTLIKNGWIWRGEETSEEPEPEDVLIENGRIVSIGLLSGVADADVMDEATFSQITQGVDRFFQGRGSVDDGLVVGEG